MMFLGLGFLLGRGGLGAIDIGPHSPLLEVVATLTLALVLFLDAVKLQISELGKGWLVPALVLGPGTGMIIGLGAVALALLLGFPLNRQPIPRLVQEHVMERDAGHERGSMLVQHNCRSYECGEDLVDKLTAVVSSYPPQVYLAPYPTMDAKIALAAPGKLLLLKAFDEDKIRGFIDANMDR
jgi:hypothetical protein